MAKGERFSMLGAPHPRRCEHPTVLRKRENADVESFLGQLQEPDDEKRMGRVEVCFAELSLQVGVELPMFKVAPAANHSKGA